MSQYEIEPEYRELMRVLAITIDELFNGDVKGKDRTVGFIVQSLKS